MNYIQVGPQQIGMIMSLASVDCGLVGPSCHSPRNCNQCRGKLRISTFNFDSEFGNEESVHEISTEAINNGAKAIVSGHHTGHACGSSSSLLTQHGSVCLLAISQPENATERDLVWVKRRDRFVM